MCAAVEIIRVPIPLPFALKFVNCYLIQGPGGWALIDTGINWAPARDAWPAALIQRGINFRDITEIYVTHYHPDHVGLAGWWQQRSGAPVYMTALEAQTVVAVWSDGERAGRNMAALFAQHGIPRQLAAAIEAQTAATQQMTQPLPLIDPLSIAPDNSAETFITIAGRAFQAFVLPGHSDAQLCLYEFESHTLLAADHVLPRISPNISILPHTLPDPLGRYLQTFELLAKLKISAVLPGHGEPFSDLQERLDQLRTHHAQRLDVMLRVLQRAEMASSTAYDVCSRVFPLSNLTPHQVQFAMGETVAHLDLLVAQDRVTCVNGQPMRYAAR